MAKTNIGRVSVVPKGEYSSIENYKRLDVVSDNGSMYISKKDNNQGNPITDKNWWFKAVEKGEVGPQGEKPVNGVDYNTDEEKEEFKNDVVNKAKEEVEKNIADIEDKAIKNYNDNATRKTIEYDTNANRKLTVYNDNATQKAEEYNSNATSKVSEYNTNASTQTETFNNNATSKTNSFDENATGKTNAFNDNYDEKMQAINEASTSIEAERKISDSKYACALKMQVKDEQQTQIYAENDVVDDLMIKSAQLTQKTREGYNLLSTENLQELNENGITLTKENGIVTINGQSISTAFIDDYFIGNSSNYEEFLTAGTYLISGITNELFNPNFGILVVIKHTDESTTTIIQNGENKSFTVREGDTFRIFIRIPQNLQLSNIVIKPMIVAGTEEKQYEQYGASPSLDFPSEIKVPDEQKILICRKNLIKSIQYMNNLDRYGWVLRFEAPLKPNTEYTIGLIGTKDNKYYLAEDFVVNGGLGFTVTMTGTMQYITFTTKENISVSPTYVENKGGYILFKNRINQPNNHIFEDVILVEGTVNEAYEPYEGQDISIPIQNLAIGDYSDIIDRENEKQDKFIVELMLDGTENWIASGSNDITNSFQLNLNYEVENYIGICNCLKTGVAGNVEKFLPLGTSLYIAVNKKRASTVEEFKALLAQLYSSGKPMKFYLIRKSASKESLTKEVKDELDKFKLYKDLNNVFIDNGSLSFKYNKSLLRAFKEQSELSASLLERVQALEAAQVNSVGGN